MIHTRNGLSVWKIQQISKVYIFCSFQSHTLFFIPYLKLKKKKKEISLSPIFSHLDYHTAWIFHVLSNLCVWTHHINSCESQGYAPDCFPWPAALSMSSHLSSPTPVVSITNKYPFYFFNLLISWKITNSHSRPLFEYIWFL